VVTSLHGGVGQQLVGARWWVGEVGWPAQGAWSRGSEPCGVRAKGVLELCCVRAMQQGSRSASTVLLLAAPS
jgi:exo-beta-1,3-glucanase (GH17 family)